MSMDPGYTLRLQVEEDRLLISPAHDQTSLLGYPAYDLAASSSLKS